MPPPLSSDDRRELLRLARAALTEIILHDRILELPSPAGRLAEPAGAFVTLRSRGTLRGCVGISEPSLPVSETVAHAAISAARNDPRFTAITVAELPEIEIEISVLSPPQKTTFGAIQVGTHGVSVVRGKNRGLLLPQVAVERGWSAQQFLEETCRKAGLEAHTWRDPETEVRTFTAAVFSERDLGLATGPANHRDPSPDPEPKA